MVAMVGSVVSTASATRSLEPMSSVAPPPATAPPVSGPLALVAGDRTDIVGPAYVCFDPVVLMQLPRLPFRLEHEHLRVRAIFVGPPWRRH